MPPKENTTNAGKGKARRGRRNSMDDFVVPDDTIFYESDDEPIPSKHRLFRNWGKANGKASSTAKETSATGTTFTGLKPTAEKMTTMFAPAKVLPTSVASSTTVSTKRVSTPTPPASTAHPFPPLMTPTSTPTLTPTNTRKIAPRKTAVSKPAPPKPISGKLASLLHPDVVTVDPFPSAEKPTLAGSVLSASNPTPGTTTTTRKTWNTSMPQALWVSKAAPGNKKTTSPSIKSIDKLTTLTPVASKHALTKVPEIKPAYVPVKTASKPKTPSSEICTACRARKVRCSGPPGVCVNCARLQQPCVYNEAASGKTPAPSVGEKSNARTFAKSGTSAEVVSYPAGTSFMLSDLFDRVLEHPEETFDDIWEQAKALGADRSATTIVEATIVVGLNRAGFHPSEQAYHLLQEHLRKPLREAMDEDEATALARKIRFLTQANIGFIKTDTGFLHRNLSFAVDTLDVDLFLSYYFMAILARLRYMSTRAMADQQPTETRIATPPIDPKTTTDSTSMQKRRQFVEDSEDDGTPLNAKKVRHGTQQATGVPNTVLWNAVQGLRAFCAPQANSEEAPSYAAMMAESIMLMTGAKLLVKAGSSVQSSLQEAMPSTGFLVNEDLDQYGKTKFAWWYNTGTTMENLYRLLQGLLQEEGTLAIPDTEGRLIPVEMPNFQVSRPLAPLVAIVDKNKTDPFYSPFIDSLLADFGIYVGQPIFPVLDRHFRAVLSDETTLWARIVLPMDFTFSLCVLQALSQLHAAAFKRNTGGDDFPPTDGVQDARDVQEDREDLRRKDTSQRLIMGGNDVD